MRALDAAGRLIREPLRIAWLCLPMLGMLAASISAGEPGVSLLRPDSLAGWDQGDPPSGWQIADGILTGTGRSSVLTSAWTLGDFSLAFRWSTAGDGRLVFCLLDVPAGPGCEVTLSAGEPGGQVTDGGRKLADARIAAGAEAWHEGRIARAGTRLTVEVDGKTLAEVPVAGERHFGLGLSAQGGEASLKDLRLAEPAGESIFNGRNFDGWWSPLGLKSWEVQNGAILCVNKDGNYLRSEKEYGNFTLSLQYRQAPHCNSGIGIRTARGGWPSGDGMELQLLDEPGLDMRSTLAIYGNLEPLARADRSGEWNSVVVKADGRMISGWINGVLVQQANTARHPELKHRHLRGWIGFQDHGGRVEFRNVRVLAAPDSLGLDAWRAPRRASGPQRVFNRILNPEAVSLDDGCTAAVASHRVTSAERQTVAELTGPGALVQIWRSKPDGRMAFYFDGAERPAIDCPAGQLHQQLPRMTEEAEPVVTCLPFAKGLRIAVEGAQGAEYRIDYVQFPADAPVETFQPGRPILPRGWLAAIDNRQQQYGWGTHREEDPAPRASGNVAKLESGQTAELVKLDGAGIVQWLKLVADARLMHADDLWLEVHIDGEPQPALAAPARYFFPALSGTVPVIGNPSNHYNFVDVYRGGFTSMLAMPFERGLTIAVRNAGSAALGKTAVVVSVLRAAATDAEGRSLDLDRRMRLRGRFERAGDAHDLATISGSGRWVGIVWSTAKEPPLAIASLTVDGEPQPGWAQTSEHAFLGGDRGQTSFFHVLSGRSPVLAWRYLLLAPVDFRKSLALTSTGGAGDRLILWYER